MEPIWIWLMIALALLIVEANTGTFYFLCLAAAAALAGLASLLGGWTLQLTVFGIATLASLPFVQRLADRFAPEEHSIKVGPERVVGERGVVVEAIDPNTGKGMIKVEGELWRATSDEYIEEGRTVLVEEMRGNKLFVYREPSLEDEGEALARLREEEEQRRLRISSSSQQETEP